MSEGSASSRIPQGKAERWPWPFSQADLTAGLRRHLGDPSIWVLDASPLTMAHIRPAIGRLRGMLVEYEGKTGVQSCQLVVKEPRGTTRTGLAGAGRREVGVYHALASHLPLKTPALVAAPNAGDWLVLELTPPVRSPANWTEEDYRHSIFALTQLHDRFWGLAEDLNAFPWLSRPLESDFEVHIAAAAKALENIVERGEPKPLVESAGRMKVLARLIEEAEGIAAPLREQPSTLMHGDYWPGNIAVMADASQVVYDWQMAAVGPGMLDLLVFVLKSEWWFEGLPLAREAMIELYRESLAGRSGFAWDEATWEVLWDHALMWRFLQEWIDLLAASPDILLETRAEQLGEIWLDPVGEAVERRLGGL